MKIHDEIWGVTSPNKRNDPELAYMTHTGSGLKKRQETDRRWAGQSAVEFTHKNELLHGFQIGDVVSRYSTSNKLFRVRDPRGFVVEIPSENVAKMLKGCTVIKGHIQERAIWAREGSNHMLLTEGSDEYREAFSKKLKTATSTVTPTKVSPGAILEDGHGDKYLYIGRYDVEAKCEINGHLGGTYDYKTRKSIPGETVGKETIVGSIGRVYALLAIYDGKVAEIPDFRRTFKMRHVGTEVFTEDERLAFEQSVLNGKIREWALPKSEFKEKHAEAEERVRDAKRDHYGCSHVYVTQTTTLHNLERVI